MLLINMNQKNNLIPGIWTYFKKEGYFLQDLFLIIHDYFWRINIDWCFLNILNKNDLSIDHTLGDSSDIVYKEWFFLKKRFYLNAEYTLPFYTQWMLNKLYKNKDIIAYYIMPCFWKNKAQLGRFWQFYQLGLEILWNSSKTYIEDILKMCCTSIDILYKLWNWFKNLPTVWCIINFIRPRIINHNQKKIMYIMHQLKHVLCKRCIKRLTQRFWWNILDCSHCKLLITNKVDLYQYNSQQDRSNFNTIISLLKHWYPSLKIIHDHNFVRGLQYYSGFVYEVQDAWKHIALIGGGEYKINWNDKWYSYGWGLGLERLFNLYYKKDTTLCNAKYYFLVCTNLYDYTYHINQCHKTIKLCFMNFDLLFKKNKFFKSFFLYIQEKYYFIHKYWMINWNILLYDIYNLKSLKNVNSMIDVNKYESAHKGLNLNMLNLMINWLWH